MKETFEKEYNRIKNEINNSKSAIEIDTIKHQQDQHPFILYGAGEMAGVAYKLCAREGLVIKCVCDTWKTGVHEATGLPIISPEELSTYYRDALIMIATWKHEREIVEMLQHLGFSSMQIFHLPFQHFIPIDVFEACFYDGYNWAYSFFSDEKSKRLVIDRARLYLTRKTLAPNTKCESNYEEDYIDLSADEVFVDGGAFIGDTAESFITKVGDYSRVYAFEPDSINYEQARRRLSKYPRVDLIAKGLFNSEKELTFYHNTEASSGSSFMFGAISHEFQTTPVTSLDVFFEGKQNNELPTFIKLDIEGAEKQALIGAKGILARVKPKLAISVYHKPEDIYELPKTILNARCDYRFALRQHEYSCYETILYAV